jgi:hypothetical protein
VSVCTAAQVKARRGVSVSDYDTMIQTIIAGVAAQFDAHCNRKLVLPATAVTLTFPGGQPRLYLPYYPVVSVTSVTEALAGAFSTATALTSGTDYVLNADRGRLVRIGAAWLRDDYGDDAVEVIVRGGYAAAGATLGEGETAMPDPIVEAGVRQADHIFAHREQMGLTSESAGGATVSVYGQDRLLPGVVELLNPFVRRLF